MSFSLSRDELLSGGIPARRAGMLLFAIENRTAQLVKQGARDAAVYLSWAGTQTREHDFFTALAQGRDTTTTVTIQHIERYAPQWQTLLPETPDAKLDAALAQMLGAKYKFTRAQTPNLRAALHLDDAAVRQAYETAYSQPIDSIFVPQLDAAARLRFAGNRAAARLEGLPPFWLAFFLTMPGAAGLLALPVALARVGLGGGLVLLIAFGVLNMFTAAALAEATARSGVTRYGLGWLGQLVQEYLGSAGSIFLTITLALNSFFVLIIFYLGVGGTLQDATRLPSGVWIVVLFGICVFFLSRGSLNATIASTLIIILLSILLLVLIPLLAIPHFNLANLSATPFISLDFASVQLGFGVLLSTYFSHLLVATYGPVVIRRDVGARAWIWGCAAAIFGFLLIACIWLVIVNGVVTPAALLNAPGTVLTPLAEIAGPVILWVGSLLVILSLGLASIQVALGLYYLVQERLPALTKQSALSNPRLRFLLSIVPIAVVFLLAEWVAFTGQGSFTNFLGVLGAFALPLLGGVFPVLLLASTRRKGEFIPKVRSTWLGNPVLLTAIYLFFVGIIFLYGLVIFTEPLTRWLMVAVGIITLGITFLMLKRGAMTLRLVIKIEQDERPTHSSNFSIVQAGSPAAADVELQYETRQQTFSVPSAEFAWKNLTALRVHAAVQAARQLKIWVLCLTPEGPVRGRDAHVEILTDGTKQNIELSPAHAEAIVPLGSAALDAHIKFDS